MRNLKQKNTHFTNFFFLMQHGVQKKKFTPPTFAHTQILLPIVCSPNHFFGNFIHTDFLPGFKSQNFIPPVLLPKLENFKILFTCHVTFFIYNKRILLVFCSNNYFSSLRRAYICLFFPECIHGIFTKSR